MDNLAALLLVAIPAILNMGILLYILISLPRGKVVNVFALFLFALLSWQIYDITARVSSSVEIVQYVDRLLNFSWLATGILLLHFVLIFTGRDKWTYRQYFLALYLPYFIILSLSVAQTSYTDYYYYSFWGWVRTDLNWIEYSQRAFIAIPVLIALVYLFVHAYQHKEERNTKLQSLLIATGILIPSVFGLYAQFFYPLANSVEIPITSTFMTFLSVAIIISLRGYNLFSLSDSINIEKTLEGLSAYVMIIDADQKVIFKNRLAQKCFNPEKHPHKKFVSLDEYFPNRKYYDEFIQEIFDPTWNDKIVPYFDTKLITHADNEIDVNISSELIMNNLVKQGVMIIANDITKRKRAERERKDILESITDGFFALDRNWKVTYWNRAAEEILQMPKDKILQKNLWDEYDDAIPLKFYKEYHRAMENQEVRQFEEYYPGTKSWFQVSAYPKKEGLAVFFKDITKDKKQELEILRIKKNREAMINSTDELIWAVNQDYRLITANTPFHIMIKQMTGNKIEEGDYVLVEGFSDDLIRDWKKMYDTALEGESFTITHKTEFNGGDLYSLVSFNPILNDASECIGVACYSKDITDRMKYIKAMEEQNERLKSIAWTQSHLVRGPLSRLMGLINLIKQGDVEEGEMDEFLSHIKASAHEIDEVIREIVEKSTDINK